MKPIQELLPIDIPTTEEALAFELDKANERLFHMNKENAKLKQELADATRENRYWRRLEKKRNKIKRRNKPRL